MSRPKNLLNSASPAALSTTTQEQPPFQADGFSATERFLDFAEVQKYIPYSKSRFYALMRENRVPRPVKIGQHRACWLLSEILAFTDARIKERNRNFINHKQGENYDTF